MIDPVLVSIVNDAPVAFTGLATTKAAVAVAIASGALLKVTFDPENVDRKTVIEAVGWIANASVEKREEGQQALYAEYSRAIEDGSDDFASAQAQLDWESENTKTFSNPIAIAAASEIWSLVRLHTVHVAHGQSGELFIDIQGEAAWDGEAGVALRAKSYGQLTIAKGY